LSWLWFLHDLVHWADDLRHFMAYAFAPYSWVTNASEQVIAAVVVVVVGTLLWPRVRHAFEGWLDRKIVGHLDTHHRKFAELLEGHMTELHQHIESASAPKKKVNP
jgi:hypothetical protein